MTLPIIRVTGARAYPPRVSEFTRPFWSALKSGRLLVSRCSHCGRQSFPPKMLCPDCWGYEMEWVDAPDQGVLYSWTRIHAGPSAFAHLAPYAVGIVDLENCLRLACPLISDADQALAIGASIEMVVTLFDDGPLFAARVQTLSR